MSDLVCWNTWNWQMYLIIQYVVIYMTQGIVVKRIIYICFS